MAKLIQHGRFWHQRENLENPEKLITAAVTFQRVFCLLFFSFVSPDLLEKELKDSQADLMTQNTNKSPQPDATVKDASTTARGGVKESES